MECDPILYSTGASGSIGDQNNHPSVLYVQDSTVFSRRADRRQGWHVASEGARGAGTGIVAEAADSTLLLLQQGEERVCLPCLAPACFVCPACLGAFTAPSVTAIQISIAHSDTPVEQEYKILNPENAVPQYSSHTGACCIPVCWAELQATLSQQPAQPTITSLAWLGIKCVGYCVPRLACNLNRLRCIRSAQTSTVPQQPVDPHLAC